LVALRLLPKFKSINEIEPEGDADPTEGEKSGPAIGELRGPELGLSPEEGEPKEEVSLKCGEVSR